MRDGTHALASDGAGLAVIGPSRGSSQLPAGVDLGLLFLRLGPAAVFVAHGYLKLFGGHHDRTVALFMTVNIPAPEPMAWLIGLLEFAGGLLLAAGAWTRLLAALFAVEMVIVLTRVRWAQGFVGAGEFEFVLFMACLALILAGSGRFSLRVHRAGRRAAVFRIGRVR